MSSLRLLFSQLRGYRPRFILVFIAGVLDGIVMFGFPLLLSEVTRDNKIERVSETIYLLIILYLASLYLQWIIRRYGESLGSEYALTLRLRYFTAIERLPLTSLSKAHSGYILSLVGRVCDGIGGLTVEMFWGVAKMLSNLTLFFLFTARESVALAVTNIVLLISFIGVSTALSRRMVPRSKELNIFRAKLMGQYSDFTANMGTIKKLGVKSFVSDSLTTSTKNTSERIVAFQRFHAARWAVLHALYGIIYLGTVAFLINRIATLQSPASLLVLFIATFATLRGLVERLSEDFKTILELNADYETLSTHVILEEKPDAPLPDSYWHDLTITDLTFTHPGNQHKITVPYFSIARGERVAILGPSGEGKSTLLRIISGLLSPDTGTFTVDSQSSSALVDVFPVLNLALISQDIELFNLSLRENLELGKTLPDASLKDLLQELSLLPWINGLEHGLDTAVGERGLRLSSGQKQRIQLVRAVLLNRELCLIDEPTAHLDRETSKAVMEFIDRHLSNSACIIAMHHRPEVAAFDKVYEFRNGLLTLIK